MTLDEAGSSVRNIGVSRNGLNTASCHARKTNTGVTAAPHAGVSRRMPMRPGSRSGGPRNGPASLTAGLLSIVLGRNEETRDQIAEAGGRLGRAAESLERAERESLKAAIREADPPTGR